MSRRIEDDVIDIGILDVSKRINSIDELEKIEDGLSKRTVKKAKEPVKEEPELESEDLDMDESEEFDEDPDELDMDFEEEPEECEEPNEEDDLKAPKLAKVSRKPIRDELYDEEEATSYLYDEQGEKAMLKNPATGEVFIIMKFPFTIGKKDDNDLCIPDKVVSRLHAEIEEVEHKYFIKDMKSLNGTFVNGYKVPPLSDMEIKSGQEIVFANKKFIFHVRGKKYE